MDSAKFQLAVSQATRALSRLRGWLPLSNLGVAVSGLAAATYWGFARPHADYALGLAAQLALLLVALALLGVFLGVQLLAAALRRRGEPVSEVTFEATRGFAWGLELPSWRWLPMLEVSWSWDSPEGVEVELLRSPGKIREQVSSPGRIRVSTVRRRFVVEDGFGLARWTMVHTEARSLRVLPFVGRLEQAPLLQSLAAGDDLPHPRGRPEGDRVDMRPYVRGDPLRLALWKVYARTGQLMVRTPERALSPSVRVLAYLPSAFADEPAAAAARWAIERGALGEQWWFSADGAPGWTSEPGPALERIMASRHERSTARGQAAGLAAFLDKSHELQEARVVLFVPGTSGPWLARVADQIRARNRNVTCVVMVDGLIPEADVPTVRVRLAQLLTRPVARDPEDEALVSQDSLRLVTQTLVRAGAQVVALDRRQGRALSMGQGGALEQAYAQALHQGGQAA